MHEEMIIIAARTKKVPRAKAMAIGEKSAKDIDKSCKSTEAASLKPFLPKISADRINEDDLTKDEEMTAIMKLEEVSLRKFLEDEPDIYTMEDLIVRYK